MMRDGEEFHVRPGRVRERGSARPDTLTAQVRRAAAKAGYTRLAPGRRSQGTGHLGRGRRAAALARFRADSRRVVIKARIVRHKGTRFRAAPMARHLTYLARNGVTRDGADARLFDSRSDHADGKAFAERCEDDRHHFRFIVSPQDAVQMEDLHAFTRELMLDMAQDLETDLDWVAVDHWNTDNPHIHVLVRGRISDGADLVIDRGYMSEGLRSRAEARVTLELGPRSTREIEQDLAREVEADRWTSLDRSLERMADERGIVDLRPDPDLAVEAVRAERVRLLGRVAKLERIGLAEEEGPGLYRLKPDIEDRLREIGNRGDIIKTMHRAMADVGHAFEPEQLAIHDSPSTDPIIGRLVTRGLDDELAGTAFAIIDGADGRAHHVRFPDLEFTGDAAPGAIVEVRTWEGKDGHSRLSLATRSDLPLEHQVTASGATWLDRQLVARDPVATGSGFGAEIRGALEARKQHLVVAGHASVEKGRLTLMPGLIDSLQQRDLEATAKRIASETGLQFRTPAEGEAVMGQYRERLTLASGRFAMVDDGLGFQLVPWRPALDHKLGQEVRGVMEPGGRVSWTLGRSRGLGL